MPRIQKLFPPRFIALLGLVVVCTLPLFAMADTTPTTTVNVGWFANFAAQYLAPTLGVIVSLGLGHVYVLLKGKFGLDIDANQREALQTAITNAAGLLIAKGAHSIDGKTIDVGNLAVAQAVKYAQDAVPGALAHFGLGPDDIAQKIVAKIGVLTGGAPPISVPSVTAAPIAPGA